jgi:anti-anti-sigma regulatory factor
MIATQNRKNGAGDRFVEKATPRMPRVADSLTSSPAKSAKNRVQPDTPLDPTATRVISLTGDVRDGGRVHEFHRECQRSIHPGRRRVVLNLAGVADADTKLVASLVAALRRAWSSRVVCDIRVSPRLRDWIALCRVERLLNGGTGAGVAS